MKSILFCMFFVGWITSSMFAQISVNQSDMPVPGDTLRVSVTDVVPAGYAKTAMDTLWNYTALEALSQRLDTFANVTGTPALYQLFFVLQGGANLASPRSTSFFPGLPLSQGFTFFKNSAASFSDLGSAYTIQGLPLPAKYDIPDKLYAFPMTAGSAWSSVSSFSITVPNFAYYSTQHFRSNVVDGWGIVATPYGTFQALRVKSTLAIHDSVYVDSLGAGFPVNRNIIEYKWLAKGQAIPVLQIADEGGVVTASYSDFYRMSAQPLTVTLGPDTSVLKGTVLTLHATVTGGAPPYRIIWNTLDSGSVITVTAQDTRTYSVIVFDALQNMLTAQKVVSIKFPPGVDEILTSQLQVYPNPTSGIIRLKLPEKMMNARMEILTAQGSLVRVVELPDASLEFNTNLNDLPDGLYFIRISAKNRIYTCKLQVIN